MSKYTRGKSVQRKELCTYFYTHIPQKEKNSTRVFACPKLDGAKDTSIPPTCSQKSLSPNRYLHLFPKIICITNKKQYDIESSFSYADWIKTIGSGKYLTF